MMLAGIPYVFMSETAIELYLSIYSRYALLFSLAAAVLTNSPADIISIISFIFMPNFMISVHNAPILPNICKNTKVCFISSRLIFFIGELRDIFARR